MISQGFVGKLQTRVHRLLERGLSKAEYRNILELGAGGLEHLQYTALTYDRYLATDIRYSKEEIQRLREANVLKDFVRVQLKLVDAESPRLNSLHFDLILATCVLIHLKNPEKALVAWKTLIKPGGEIAIYVPAEPGLFLRIGRRLFIRPKHRKLGIHNSDLLYAREHVTSFSVLNSLIREVFSDCQIKAAYWPIPILRSWNLNAAIVFTIRLPGPEIKFVQNK